MRASAASSRSAVLASLALSLGPSGCCAPLDAGAEDPFAERLRGADACALLETPGAWPVADAEEHRAFWEALRPRCHAQLCAEVAQAEARIERRDARRGRAPDRH